MITFEKDLDLNISLYRHFPLRCGVVLCKHRISSMRVLLLAKTAKFCGVATVFENVPDELLDLFYPEFR